MKKLLCLAICLCIVSVTQATILKFEAENHSLVYDYGTADNWADAENENASGGAYITATVNSTSYSADNERVYKFSIPAGTYNLYVRLSMSSDGGSYNNDSMYVSEGTFSETITGQYMQNGTPENGLDDVSTVDFSFGWVEIAAGDFVQDADGDAYLHMATREDGLYVDAIAFVSTDETASNDLLNNAPTYDPLSPYDPVVTPLNEDGSVGTPVNVGGEWQISDLYFAFKASPDPNEDYGVNPNILEHHIYIQTQAAGPDDPNYYHIAALEQSSLTDPNQSFGPLIDYETTLAQGTTFNWRVEQVIADPNGVPYGPNDPNNMWGPVWSFTTANAIPSIASISDHMLTVDGNAAFEITTGIVADNFRWYKVNGAKDSWNEETGAFEVAEDDVADEVIADGGIYSGATTKILTITGANADGSDDAYVYAQAFNGAPGENGTTSSVPSSARWFWAPRKVNQYTFESSNPIDGNEFVIDTLNPGVYDLKLLGRDVGPDKPVVEPNVPSLAGLVTSNSLFFNNPRLSDPNTGDTQYAEVQNGWAGGYKDITISAWVYSKGSSNWNRILDFGNNTDNYMMICTNINGDSNQNVRFEVKLNGTAQSVTTDSNTALPVGEWTHLVVTLGEDTGRIFINGELEGTNTDMTNDPVRYGPSTRNWLGRSQWGSNDGFFNGLIDELNIWNHSMSVDEVGKLYLTDTLEEYVCNLEIYDLGVYDVNNNCLIDLADFAALAARWLESDRIYPAD